MSTVGTLTFHPPGTHARRATWGVEALPHVMIRVKRIFPRVQTSVTGRVYVADTPDVAMDIDWLTQRHPLAMTPDVAAHLERRVTEHVKRAEAVDAIMAGGGGLALELEPARPLRPYQEQFVAMARVTRRILLGDDLGLGKTTSAAGLLGDPAALPALVVCPPHLQRQWMRELGVVWPLLRAHIVTRGRPYDLRAVRGAHGYPPDVLIISYAKLAGWEDALADQFPTVIFDEVHDLRAGTDTQKGTAAARIADGATTVVGMSATPVTNYGDEIHNLYSILAPDVLGERAEFLREWGGGVVGSHTKVRDPRALGTYLREQGVFLRRTRADVGRELPSTPLRIRHEIDSDPRVIEQASADVAAMARLILDTTADREKRFVAAGQFDMRMRQATGIAKAPYVAEFVRMLLASEPRILLVGWHRACFAAGTRALMHDGTVKNVEDVVVGDHVLGPDSRPRLVKNLTRGRGQMYRVVPNKGEPWVCSARHILTVWNGWARRYEEWTAEEFAAKPARWQRERLLYRTDAVAFEGASPVLEPWLMGYWIGDGAASLQDLRVASADPEVESELRQIAERHGLALRVWDSRGASGTSACKHLVLSAGPGGPKDRNGLRAHFRALGLTGRKRIPFSYATAPVPDRRELLAGLLDSDGHVYRGLGVGSASYSANDRGLADEVAFLARSLGLAAYVSAKTRGNGGFTVEPGSTYYSVNISGDLTVIPTRIARKQAAARSGQKNVLRTGFCIEPAGVDDYYGFEVDADHLFLLEDFTVVHNCYDIWLDRLAEYRPVLYSGSESAGQKARAVDAFLGGGSRVMIMSLRSGVGLDGLQEACRTVVFGELDWSPAIHDQIVGRLARDGQEHDVNAYFLVSEAGADPVMDETLQLKRGQSVPITDPNAPLFEPTAEAALRRVELLARSFLAGG